MTTIEIIESLSDGLSFTIPVDNIVDNSDGTYDINVDCVEGKKRTYHVSVSDCAITLDSKQYKVVSVDNDSMIVIKELSSGAGAPSITEFPVSAPHFFAGTTVEVNADIGKIRKETDKFPMLFMIKRFSESFNNIERIDSIIDRTASIKIFALQTAKSQDWDAAQLEKFIEQPMRNLLKELIDAFNLSEKIGTFESYTITSVPFFGIFNENAGETDTIFDEWCGGAELNINLPIERDLNCDC